MLKNNALPFDQLPQAEDLAFESLPRISILSDFLRALLFWVVAITGLLVAAAVSDEVGSMMPMLWWVLVPLCLGSLAWPFLAWRYRQIALREHDVLLREGVIWRSLTAQSLQRVQHVKLEQGPLQRRWGLATLVLYTSGRSKADFKLRHLPYERAERLREYILRVPLAG